MIKTRQRSWNMFEETKPENLTVSMEVGFIKLKTFKNIVNFYCVWKLAIYVMTSYRWLRIMIPTYYFFSHSSFKYRLTSSDRLDQFIAFSVDQLLCFFFFVVNWFAVKTTTMSNVLFIDFVFVNFSGQKFVIV